MILLLLRLGFPRLQCALLCGVSLRQLLRLLLVLLLHLLHPRVARLLLSRLLVFRVLLLLETLAFLVLFSGEFILLLLVFPVCPWISGVWCGGTGSWRQIIRMDCDTGPSSGIVTRY
ncbi:MAG TPA: hypothetical protein VND90_12485 [Terracidiphilus sp.]|nr:hypothetical protein [Terracidiphilus sp.]